MLRLRAFVGIVAVSVGMLGAASAQDARPGPSADLEKQIRAIGNKVDPVTSDKIYKALHDAQPTEGVKRTNDQAYGSHERNKVDVYVPERAAASAMPVVIFVHGGGFMRGDKKDRDNIGYFFARNGVVGLVMNYRLAPANQWPAGAEDVAAAVNWARANVAALGGDPEKIYLFGESAGAAHVATATLLKRLAPTGRLPIAGAVFTSGVYDPELERIAARQFSMPTPEPRNTAYFGPDASTLPGKAVLRLIDAPEIPVLLTYAELDPVQMQVQAGAMFNALCNRSGRCPELALIPSHGHITQILAVNTGDLSLAGPVLEFIRKAK